MNLRYATTIGSMPYKDARHALETLIKYTPNLPAWPQLPKRDFKENMYAQYSERFPGITVDSAARKVFVDSSKAYNELELFYEKYLAKDTEYFTMTEEYSAGFYEFLRYLQNKPHNTMVKCQITGPVTYGLGIRNESDQPIFYDAQLKDVVIKHIVMKSLWQISRVASSNNRLSRVILFLDEPFLVAYGSAYTAVSREDIASAFKDVVADIREHVHNNYRGLELLIGVHCCGNTDWSLLLDSGIDILSFDSFEYFDNLMLYFDSLKKFIHRRGVIAWGCVPSSEKILEESGSSLLEKFMGQVDKLISKGLTKKSILGRFLVTPSCGLGSLSEELAENILIETKKLFASIEVIEE